MNKAFSVYLDAVRFFAALGVFAAHFVYVRWTGGVFPDSFVNAVFFTGADFVMVFFVLSGFVIAYTVDVKDSAWERYTFNRATRIYSVAVPAVLLTFLLDRIGLAFNAADYDGWWYADQSIWELLVRGLTFSNEFWRWPFRLGSNGPYWSLGYEIWYYVLFGIFVFGRGWARIVALAMVAILVGSGILLLAPIWMLGVFLYYACQRGWFSRQASILTLAIGASAAVVPIAVYIALRVTGGDDFLNAAAHSILVPLRYLGGVGMSFKFLWFWTIGVLVAVHFVGMAVLLQSLLPRIDVKISTAIQWLAGASFSIYIIHYPVMQAIDAILVGETNNGLRAVVLGVSTLAFCFVFAALFERRLHVVRAWIKALNRGVAAKAAKPKASTPQN